MTSMTRQYSAAASQARNAVDKTADVWTEGARAVTGRLFGLPRVDLVPAVERYFDLVQRAVEINRRLAVSWAEAAATLSGAVREKAESAGDVVREKAEAAGDIAREQAEKAERAAREQAAKAEQAERSWHARPARPSASRLRRPNGPPTSRPRRPSGPSRSWHARPARPSASTPGGLTRGPARATKACPRPS